MRAEPSSPSVSGPHASGDDARARKDLATGEVMPEERLIRFAAAPDGSVVPDLARKLPGRGMWVEASREAVDAAVKKNLFSRSAKAKLTAQPDLADLVERLLARRVLEQLGLARREGVLVNGFEKAHMALKSGKVAWLIEASDGSPDGRNKLLSAATRQTPPVPVLGAFSAEELGLALGLDNVIHVVLLAGRRADRWTEEVRKLAGFRPLLPPSWREEARNGRGG
ncbi:RNA-binding protein [Caulobacter sp. 17J65-9]|uniref:RNA-binding protein n=1 Tax=Caulobacter sp. 17J65-9 TaxID=2709382 RepID=UPI0013C8153A|nr:RNA-binding protein [Caulobacter sp. 17J65-9]NEX94261.1 RNA-binding protein [Caulobacter sp. 17J65-9]